MQWGGPGELAPQETGVGKRGKPASPSTWGWPGAPQETGAFKTEARQAHSPVAREVSWAPRFKTRPAWGRPGTHQWGGRAFLRPPQPVEPGSRRGGLPHAVRGCTQTRAQASRISDTKSHVGMRANGGRVQASPAAGPVLVPVAFCRPQDTQACS